MQRTCSKLCQLFHPSLCQDWRSIWRLETGGATFERGANNLIVRLTRQIRNTLKSADIFILSESLANLHSIEKVADSCSFQAMSATECLHQLQAILVGCLEKRSGSILPLQRIIVSFYPRDDSRPHLCNDAFFLRRTCSERQCTYGRHCWCCACGPRVSPLSCCLYDGSGWPYNCQPPADDFMI